MPENPIPKPKPRRIAHYMRYLGVSAADCIEDGSHVVILWCEDSDGRTVRLAFDVSDIPDLAKETMKALEAFQDD